MLLPIYREKDLEFDSELDFPGRKFEVKSLLARELARQVFVGVASKYRDSDTWLNEMLAWFYSHYFLMEVSRPGYYMLLALIKYKLLALAAKAHCRLRNNI